MTKIHSITIHCSASSPDVHVDAKVINRWHLTRGFRKIGYHFVILRDGSVEKGRELHEAGAHVAGHNTGNLGICLAGGVDKAGKSVFNYEHVQMVALRELLVELKKQFPEANVLGHRDWPKVAKDCPCFDVKTWLKSVGL